MISLSVIEGFYGTPWSTRARKSWAHFLSTKKGSSYIYAPKSDRRLRKLWRNPWQDEDIHFFSELCKTFQNNHVPFGIGLSPFGLASLKNFPKDEVLRKKIDQLNQLNLNFLGIFFDDMTIHEDMARQQVDFLHFIQERTNAKILFCPSFYSDDPILDQVFGARPVNYLNDIGSHLNQEIDIFWTGPKVISPEISMDHLHGTKELLQRWPIIWDNSFANDGPRNCKFLKLKPYEGRSFKQGIQSIYLNLMNQPYLSMILFETSHLTLQGFDPEKSWEVSLSRMVEPDLVDFLMRNQHVLCQDGLDRIDDERRKKFLYQLKIIKDHEQSFLNNTSDFTCQVIDELEQFLTFQYVVDSDCLTD